MAPKIGFLATLEMGTDGVNWTSPGALGNIKSLDWGIKPDTADTTSFDGVGWKSQIYSTKQGTLGVSCVWDDSAAQVSVITAALAGTTYYYRYRPETGTGKVQYVFTATIGDVKGGGGTGDAQKFDFTLTTTGTVTKSAQ